MLQRKLRKTTERDASPAPSQYIVSPTYDCVFFLLPPTVALCLGVLISGSGFANQDFVFYDQDVTWSGLLIGIFIHAHLVAVFFRSHGNAAIRQLHPYRFLLVPVLLYVAMVSSLWVMISVSVLATFWDVYHSALQTFGFGRIYDRKTGNDPTVGRRLDWHLNHLLYAGPILAGATMMDHIRDFGEYDRVGATLFTSIPGFMEANQGYVSWVVLIAGGAFLVYYVWAQMRLRQQGYAVSLQKVYLLVSTGAVSIYTWGFNTFGEAFFIMNFFHALQYGSSQRSVQFWSVSMANKSSIVSDLHGWRTPSVSGEELQAPGKSGPQETAESRGACQFQGAKQSARVRPSGRTSAKVEAALHESSWFVAL